MVSQNSTNNSQHTQSTSSIGSRGPTMFPLFFVQQPYFMHSTTLPYYIQPNFPFIPTPIVQNPTTFGNSLQQNTNLQKPSERSIINNALSDKLDHKQTKKLKTSDHTDQQIESEDPHTNDEPVRRSHRTGKAIDIPNDIKKRLARYKELNGIKSFGKAIEKLLDLVEQQDIDLDNFQNLPSKLFLHLLSFLPRIELRRFAMVNHRWREHCYSPMLWLNRDHGFV